MLYLSRLLLNERSPDVRRDLADCHRLHSRILRAFPQIDLKDNVREQFGVLYRVESPEENRAGWCLLTQSAYQPDWSFLPPTYPRRMSEIKRVDHVYERIGNGLVLRFRLRANPTKRVGRRDDPRWQGRRVALRTEEEQVEWLQRKGERHGFLPVPARKGGKVAEVRSTFEPDAKGRRKAARDGTEDNPSSARQTEQITLGSTLFEGVLLVTDADKLRLALEQGVGSGKAFGFGLLSVAPVAAAVSGRES